MASNSTIPTELGTEKIGKLLSNMRSLPLLRWWLLPYIIWWTVSLSDKVWVHLPFQALPSHSL
jgi:hypothetical protein